MAVEAAPLGAVSRRGDRARVLRHVDVPLAASVLAIAALGVVMVYSSTRGPDAPYDATMATRQALYAGVGVVVMVVAAAVDFRRYRRWAPGLYLGAVAVLVAVLTPLGMVAKGSQAWFQLGGFQLQPSEFAKLPVILGGAAVAARSRGRLSLPGLLVVLALTAVPVGLILLQPDVGTVLVFAATALVLLLVGGARGRHLAVLALLGAVGLVAVLQSDLLKDYQKDRLTAFLEQEGDVRASTYNLNQSKIAIGSGGFSGKGLFQGSQTNLSYVPEQHTDFIFTAVGEELGFVGAGSLLALFGVVVWRMWLIARLARDDFGALLCAGVLGMFVFQIFQNVGMTMGIMPITGIPLPFVSYGGSSTVTCFAAVGAVLSVRLHRFS